MTFDEFTPISGDITLASDKSMLGKLINWAESTWHGDNSIFCHAFTWVDATSCVEALVHITRSPKEKFRNRNLRTYQIPISPDERKALADGLIARVNGAYGWDKYPLFAMDAGVSWFKRVVLRMPKPCYFFTSTFHIGNIPVCSELVVWGLYKFTSYKLRDEKGEIVPWVDVTPDYLSDLLELPINDATMIYEQGF